MAHSLRNIIVMQEANDKNEHDTTLRSDESIPDAQSENSRLDDDVEAPQSSTNEGTKSSSSTINKNIEEIKGIKSHIRGILHIATPIILSEFFQNTLPIIDLAFVGNLGKEELAAGALATVWFNLWNISMFGFLTAIDTILAQACGAEEWEKFGMWTGTSLVITAGVSLLAVGVVATCGPVMKLFGQQEHLANMAGAFTLRLLPGMPPFYLFKVLTKYLQTQNILLPSVLTGILANFINVLANYLFIHTFGMGLNGAPWATTFTRAFELLVIVIYMYWKKNSTLKKSWPSFRIKNMTYDKLRPFWALGIFGALSLSSEGWSFEITTVLAGLLGTVELDAHTVTLTIASFLFLSFPFAIGISTSIRVGQLIGEGRAKDAKRTFAVSMGFATGVQIILMGILIPSGPFLGKLFSNDEEVIALVTRLIPVSAIFMLGDAIHANAVGTCRGLGRQNLSLALNTIGFWVLAVPAGALLTFVAKLGVSGLWWGFNIGIYSAAVIGFLTLYFFIDWDKETKKAIKRISTIDEGGLPTT